MGSGIKVGNNSGVNVMASTSSNVYVGGSFTNAGGVGWHGEYCCMGRNELVCARQWSGRCGGCDDGPPGWYLCCGRAPQIATL